MKSVININGKLFNENDAKISVFDRGFLYGDSIYEVTLTYKSHPVLLNEHIDRLWESGSKIHMPIHISKEDLIFEVYKSIQKLSLERVYIRIIITRGEGEINLDPTIEQQNNFIIIVKELPEYPKTWYENGVSVIIPTIKRNSIDSTNPGVKSGNYLNNVLALGEAKKKKAYDAIMLNREGYISEGTTSNVWIVKNGEFITPPLSAGILSGITRSVIFKILKAENISVREENFTPETLKSADGVFFCSSTKEIVPIVKVDDQIIGDGFVPQKIKHLSALYKNFISQKSV